jgi:hypothetical protein
MACAGCPGTIEDRASFEELGVARVDSGGGQNEDAAAPAQDAGLDASEPPVEDAGGGSQEPDASEDSGRAEPEGGPEADAATDAGESDSGIGCDFAALLKRKCDGCHGAPPAPNPLDLISPDLAGRLAGRSGTGDCSNYQLIDPERPEQSVLYLKVTPDYCGSRMPLNSVLTDGEQACILSWIESL